MTVDLTKQYSLNSEYPVDLPDRIRLSDGSTITGRETFTQEQIADAGWVIAPDKPSYNSDQYIKWAGDDWQVIDYTTSDRVEKWENIRNQRNERLEKFDWRVTRNLSETRQGIPNTDDLAEIDRYMEELRQLPQTQSNPWDITWPTTTIVGAQPDDDGPSDGW